MLALTMNARYKQDHGGGEIAQLKAAQTNVSVMANWLTPQASAAAKHNVTKMLCGRFVEQR